MARNNLPSKLKIIELNVRSLVTLHRRHDMKSFLKINKPDALLLCETNLNDHHNLHFSNYNFVRTNRSPNTNNRGTGIIVANKLKHEIIDTRGWGLTALECTAIKIATENEPISLVSVYRNLSTNNSTTFTDDLTKIHTALSSNSSIVIGGDLNARHTLWRNAHSCNHGKKLVDWLQQNAPQLKLESTLEPTFYVNNYSSYLDLFIVSDKLNIQYNAATPNALEIADYNSDHRAVILNVQLTGRPLQANKTTFINFAKANWRSLKQIVEQNIQQVETFAHQNMTKDQIDTAITATSNIITDAIKQTIPLTEVHRDSLITLPKELTDLIDHKNRIRRQWQRNKYSHNAHSLKSEINNLQKIIKDQIRIAHSNHWTKTLTAIKVDNNTFKHINRLTARGKKNTIANLYAGGVQCTSDDDKANALALHFENAHQSSLSIGDSLFTSSINNEIHSSLSNNFTARNTFSLTLPANPSKELFSQQMHAVSTDGLKLIIKSRKNKKSTGFDEIPNIVLRKLGKNFIAALTTIINQAFNIGYFPNAWKNAKVIAIAKTGKPPADPNSYRPIALLPCISKIFECVIHYELKHQCDVLQVIPDDQFGFRSRRSTVHPLVKLQQDVVNEFTKKTPTIAITIDIAKAFDTVWIEGLIHKMLNTFRFDAHLCRIIYSYLTNRTFSVNINKSTTSRHPIAAGVPQGGVLSASLYIIYVADMPKPSDHAIPIKRLQYADDVLIYISVRNLRMGKSRIESYVKTIITYLTKWKLQISPQKCEAILFKSTRRFNCSSVNKLYKSLCLQICNTQLLPQSTIKYLGVTLQSNAFHTRHVDQIIRKTNAASYAILPILKKVNGLRKEVKLLCYKQLIRPIIAYAFPCWSNITSHQMERLRMIERRTIRRCINYKREIGADHIANKKLYQAANIERIDKFLTQQGLRFFERASFEIESPILMSLQNEFPTEAFDAIKKYKPPDMLARLHAEGRLYTGEQLLYYHRRFNPTEGNNDLVYNTGQ